MADDPDAGLVAAAVAGDREAFAALLRRPLRSDSRAGVAHYGSRADADDIAQDVCCALVEKIGGFRGEAKFAPGSLGITFNACHDLGAGDVRSPGSPTSSRCWSGLARGADGRDVNDDAIWLKSAIARLKPACRDTAVLVAGQQLTHAEAAEILGVAEATISWRMSEVRRMLTANSA